MEFKKIPPSGSLPSAPPADPETQTRETLRLLARRHLHGARGILYIAGSLMLVFSAINYLAISGTLGFEPGPALDIQIAAAGIAVGVAVIACGWLVLKMPRLATILPVVLFLANIATALTLTLQKDKPPGITIAVLQLGLAALIFKAIREAFAFQGEVANIREAIRSAAILRNKSRDR